MLDRGAFGDGLVHRAIDRRVDAGGKAGIDRRAIQGLRGKQPRQPRDLPGRKQLLEADVATEQALLPAPTGMMTLSGAVKPKSSQIS